MRTYWRNRSRRRSAAIAVGCISNPFDGFSKWYRVESELVSCRSQAKKTKHDRGDSENGPLGNAHVFDTIANAFDDARKEISDGLHGEDLLGRIRPKSPSRYRGQEIQSVETVGRGPELSRKTRNLERKRLKNCKFRVSKMLILSNKRVKQGHHAMESQGNSGQNGNSPCSAWNQGYNPSKRRGRSSIG